MYKILFDWFGIRYRRRFDAVDANNGDACDDGTKPTTTSCNATGTMAPSSTSDSDPSSTPTATPSTASPTETFYCGCPSCTDDVWKADALGTTCGDRITHLQSAAGGNLDAAAACEAVANRYPVQCGFYRCDPRTCRDDDGKAATFCGCPHCGRDTWYRLTGDFTCGERILYLQSLQGGNLTLDDACRRVSNQFPFDCGSACHPDYCHSQENEFYCGCEQCAASGTWDAMAGDNAFTCGDRIKDVFRRRQVDSGSDNVNRANRNNDNRNKNPHTEACVAVSRQFPLTCGPACHPHKCDDKLPALCGCHECTAEIWNRPAGEYTCGGRIQNLILEHDYSELAACKKVVSQYPLSCGHECHPDKCDGQAPPLCGCASCTGDLWGRQAGEYSCGGRIMDRIRQGHDELEACEFIAELFPFECGPECHPQKCDSQAPAVCGCHSCTKEVWGKDADPFTCGGRISYLKSEAGGQRSEAAACRSVSFAFPFECGYCHPDRCDNQQPTVCGCEDCVKEIWDRQAGNFTCGQRIRFLQSASGGALSELEACKNVSTVFPDVCGPSCNPEICDGRGPAFCGCRDCSERWSTSVAGFTCGEHIKAARVTQDLSLLDACAFLSDIFPGVCGPACHPGEFRTSRRPDESAESLDMT